MEISHECIGIDITKINRYINKKFYDIGTPKEGKFKIKQGVDTLLSILKKISEEQNQDFKLPSIEIIPKYLENLILLIKETIKNRPYVNKYLILNDIIYRSILHGRSKSIDGIAKSSIQANNLKKTNDLILRILHDGPIMPDFNNFV